jgi:DNA repair ATPase RecN
MAELEGIEEQASRDLATLEDQLQQRAEEIRRLERELREAERISHELVRELEDRPARAQADPDLASRLDGLAAINAEREGDLAAARYRVRQLEVELEEARDASSRLAELEAALDEARSQVQRQATLLAQHRSGVGPESSSPGSLESQ